MLPLALVPASLATWVGNPAAHALCCCCPALLSRNHSQPLWSGQGPLTQLLTFKIKLTHPCPTCSTCSSPLLQKHAKAAEALDCLPPQRELVSRQQELQAGISGLESDMQLLQVWRGGGGGGWMMVVLVWCLCGGWVWWPGTDGCELRNCGGVWAGSSPAVLKKNEKRDPPPLLFPPH